MFPNVGSTLADFPVSSFQVNIGGTRTRTVLGVLVVGVRGRQTLRLAGCWWLLASGGLVLVTYAAD